MLARKVASQIARQFARVDSKVHEWRSALT
jgi:hypothetical protein